MASKHPIHQSFGFAFRGIARVLKEQNFRIQLLAALISILLGFILKISCAEWVCITLCIGFVLCLEMVNTAIESTIDLLHPDWNEKAGTIKDISAGAVLIASITSAIVGGIIFIPKIMLMCSEG
jgi:diacylglycerol kinase